MSRITQKFKQNQGTLAIGTVPGYPDLKTSFEIVKAIISGGADILEFSSSFSDPVADGPTLQQAHAKVLKQGISKTQVFNFYKKIRKNYPELPMFVIEYSNIVYSNGIENYYKKLKASGVDLLLIPDVPLEELGPYKTAAKKYGIEQSYIAAPTTDNERLKKIIPNVNGFIYVATVTGITGARKKVEDETKKLLQRIKKQTKIPLVAGFGISKPEHVKTALKSGADGVVICSQIINIINKNLITQNNAEFTQKDAEFNLKNKKNMLGEVENFVAEMKRACKV